MSIPSQIGNFADFAIKPLLPLNIINPKINLTIENEKKNPLDEEKLGKVKNN